MAARLKTSSEVGGVGGLAKYLGNGESPVAAWMKSSGDGWSCTGELAFSGVSLGWGDLERLGGDRESSERSGDLSGDQKTSSVTCSAHG